MNVIHQTHFRLQKIINRTHCELGLRTLEPALRSLLLIRHEACQAILILRLETLSRQYWIRGTCILPPPVLLRLEVAERTRTRFTSLAQRMQSFASLTVHPRPSILTSRQRGSLSLLETIRRTARIANPQEQRTTSTASSLRKQDASGLLSLGRGWSLGCVLFSREAIRTGS